MDKELIDRAWACLPREFKEEVKKDYKATTDSPKWDEAYNCALEETFGIHNLTSDAEGEEDEMLCVSRERLQDEYAFISKELSRRDTDAEDYIAWNYAKMTFEELFGSKCLPDETKDEAKPQPKFHKGDRVKVIIDGFCEDVVLTITDINEIYPQFSYKLSCSPDVWFAESTLELYEVPKPAEPKYKVGDKVRTMNVIPKQDIGRVGTVVINKDGLCNVRYNDNSGVWCDESDLEPYTEPFDTKDDTKEPKFKVGDYAMMGEIKVKITGHDEHYPFVYEVFVPNWNSYTFAKASILKSNSEPTDNPIPSNSTDLNSQEADKHFDNIIKDGFRNERRLRIAAMAMQGMLSNTTRFSSYEISDLVRISLNCADALIAESEKGSEK